MVLVAAGTAAGCGRDLTRDELVESFRIANPEASVQQSECVVDRLVAEYGFAGMEAELQTPDPEADFAIDQYRAEFGCGLTDDVETQLVSLLIAQDFGNDDAVCMAEALVHDLTDADLDVLILGTITDDFFDSYFGAVADCNAFPTAGADG